MTTCRYCHATTRQIKVGKSEAGLQIYRCKHCDQLYTLEWRRPTPSGSAPELATANYGNDRKPVAPDLHDAQRTEGWELTNHKRVRVPAHIPAGADMRADPAHSASTEPETAPQRALRRSVSGKPRFFSKAESTVLSNKWGWLPELALLESLGLLILAWAFGGARTATASAEILWWIGLAVMILPVILRLASVEASRQERIGLVLLLGMGLYLVKVMHSPAAFTFPDELSHLRNVGEILESQRLFQENPIQPVTAFYPGLPTVTSTLSSLSGLSIFHAGLLVIGTARLILFLALYLLFEQVSGSARVAGLGTALYMANPNFLYWTAEYAYEPLALPVLIFVLLMVAKREMAEDRTHSKAWTAAAVLGLLTVIVTHHMSSYILTALLCALVALFMFYSRGKNWGPWQIALVALFATSIWVIFVANLTIEYLLPVLSGAIQSAFRMVAEEETGRELFKSTTLTTEARAPIWEQLVAMGSVVVITLGLPLGVLEIWQRHRHKMFAVLFAMIALAYLPMQMLRFTKDGWETANRSSEFLFIGIGFVLALGIVKFWLTNWTGSKSRMLLAALSVALFFGGLIAGWPPRARLARPYVIDTGDYLVRPQVITVAEWMLEHLGPDNRVAASKADAKVIGAYGQYPFTDNGPIKNLFLSAEFGRTELRTLIKREIQYVVSDRKVVSWDHMIGYYFYSSHSTRASDLRMLEPQISEKLDGVEGITRMLDSGDIVIYGVEPYLAAYKQSEDAAGLESPLDTLSDHQSYTNSTSGQPVGSNADWSHFTTVAWNPSSGEAPLYVEPAQSRGIPRAGCVSYMVHPDDMRLNLSPWFLTIDGYAQLECLDWGAP